MLFLTAIQACRPFFRPLFGSFLNQHRVSFTRRKVTAFIISLCPFNFLSYAVMLTNTSRIVICAVMFEFLLCTHHIALCDGDSDDQTDSFCFLVLTRSRWGTVGTVRSFGGHHLSIAGIFPLILPLQPLSFACRSSSAWRMTACVCDCVQYCLLWILLWCRRKADLIKQTKHCTSCDVQYMRTSWCTCTLQSYALMPSTR